MKRQRQSWGGMAIFRAKEKHGVIVNLGINKSAPMPADNQAKGSARRVVLIINSRRRRTLINFIKANEAGDIA